MLKKIQNTDLYHLNMYKYLAYFAIICIIWMEFFIDVAFVFF